MYFKRCLLIVTAASSIFFAAASLAAAQMYEELMRQPAVYTGVIVGLQGKVVQSVRRGLDYILRVDVTFKGYNIWSDTVYVEYRASPTWEPGIKQQIIEGDIIAFRGKFVGFKTYTSVIGSTITIPHIIACELQDAASTFRNFKADCVLGTNGTPLQQQPATNTSREPPSQPPPALDASGPYALNLGNGYFGAKAYDLAIQQYDYAIDHGAPAYYVRGNAWYEKQDYERAIADFTQAIKTEPGNYRIYAKRADAYAHKGDSDSAIADYRRAMALDPDETIKRQINAALAAEPGRRHVTKHRARAPHGGGFPWLR